MRRADKAKASGGSKQERHERGIADQMEADTQAPERRNKGEKRRRRQTDEDEQLTEQLSNKILVTARAQRDELDAEDRELSSLGASARTGVPTLGRTVLNAALEADSDSDNDSLAGGEDAMWEEEEEIEVTAEDEAAIAAFLDPEPAQTRTLADIILERLQSEGAAPAPDQDVPEAVAQDLDPKVVEVYTEIGKVLSRYKSGKVPKAFKVIPSLRNWEEVLFLTDPPSWTPHALYQATRIFASNLNAKMAQRFNNLVLLPRFRADVREHKKIHFTLFQALKKATYKPAAFYKGVLLPLLQSRSCTLREAVILTSVVQRTSLPVVHSSVALLKLAEMEYNGVASFFIRVLLDKKYALPYRVVDSLVEHFVKFEREERTLPVVWHQSLLCFVQRYKHETRAEDKTKLLRLIKTQRHYLVSAEIARELTQGRSRGEADPDAAAANPNGAAAPAARAPLGAIRPAIEDLRDFPAVALQPMEY
mmetsp:Transcript_21620/g.69903  ORF Transcript_21620/g.69903 Transcript_21620/m.69903 type:complete len:478 (-) Transcript_21620:140-1573(-)